jgi:nitroreductase
MQLGEAIKKRKSVKKFSDSKPDWRKVIKSIDTARFSPSAGNYFSMKFILIQDEKKIEKIAEACQQEFVGKAKILVVAVSDESKLVQSFGERGKRYTALQAGAAIENFLLSIVEHKFVTTWVGHYYDDKIKEILGVPQNFIIEGIFPIGKETKLKTPEKSKADLENILYFDSWKNKKLVPEPIVET